MNTNMHISGADRLPRLVIRPQSLLSELLSVRYVDIQMYSSCTVTGSLPQEWPMGYVC